MPHKLSAFGPVFTLLLWMGAAEVGRAEAPGGANTATLYITWKSNTVFPDVPYLDTPTVVTVNGHELAQLRRNSPKTLKSVVQAENAIELKCGKARWSHKFKLNPQEVYTVSFILTAGDSFSVTRSDADEKPAVAASNLVLDKDTKRVFAKEEFVTSLQGVDYQISRSHAIDQSIEFSQANALGGSAGLNLSALSASVSAQVEKRRSIQLRTNQTVSRAATIRGDVGGRKYRLVWYDLIRGGTVDVSVAGGTKTLGFQYKEDAELDVSAVP